MGKPRFEIFTTKEGFRTVRFRAGNEELLFIGETHATNEGLMKSIDYLKEHAATAEVVDITKGENQ